MSSRRITTHLFAAPLLTLSIGAVGLAPATIAQEHEQPAQESEEVRTVRRRLKVMRMVVEAFVEADNHDAAELVEEQLNRLKWTPC